MRAAQYSYYWINKARGNYRCLNCGFQFHDGKPTEHQCGAAHKVIVEGTTMVQGPGHLTRKQADRWIKIYQRINPHLPECAIYTENFYR